MAVDPTSSEPDNTAQTEKTSDPSIWIRGLYMLLFAIVTRLTEIVIGLVMLIQFVLKAATGGTNSNLVDFGNQLSQYLFEIVQFQTFNTEDKTFPFSQWPQAGNLGKQITD